MIWKRFPWTMNALPCSSGLLGLMVATSKLGLAFASIGGSLGGGGGMVHSVSGVARDRVKRERGGPLTPVAGDRLAIRTQLALIGATDHGERHLHRAAIQRHLGHGKAVATLIDAVEDRFVAAAVGL